MVWREEDDGNKDFSKFAAEVRTKVEKDRKTIARLYGEHGGDWKKLSAALKKEFGWTEQQAYIATEDWYRPENRN